MNTVKFLSSAYNARSRKVLDSVADPTDLVETWGQAVRSIGFLDPETEQAVESACTAIREREGTLQQASTVLEPYSRKVGINLRYYQYGATDSEEKYRIRRARKLTTQLQRERGWRFNGEE